MGWLLSDVTVLFVAGIPKILILILIIEARRHE